MNSQPYVIFQNKPKIIFVGIMCVVLFVLALFFLISGSGAFRYLGWGLHFVVFIGIFGTLFFGGMGIYLLYRIFTDKPILTITSDGFTDCTTIGAPGFIAWSEVESIKIQSVLWQKFICIGMTDVKQFLSTKPWYVRMFTRTNKALGYQAITINLSTIRDKPQELVEKMNEYFDAWKKTNRPQSGDSAVVK